MNQFQEHSVQQSRGVLMVDGLVMITQQTKPQVLALVVVMLEELAMSHLLKHLVVQ